MTISRSVLGLGCITFVLALGACATQQEEGVVTMGVTSTGTDGSTYQLPLGTRLTLAGTSTSNIPNYDVSLDGNRPDVRLAVAIGSYQATLYNTNATYTTQWPLVRVNSDGTTTNVNATLTTMLPMTVAVQQGQTTPLGLQFTIPNGGTITFGRGTVDVTVGVGSGSATSYTAAADGSGSAGTPDFEGPYATSLQTLMPAAGAGLQIAVAASLTGAFQETGGNIETDGASLGACAPITITSSSGGGNVGLTALVAEAGHGTAPDFLFGPASLCIIDDGTTNQVRIRMAREGAAETPTFQAILGTTPALFWNVVTGTLPQRVYDSTAGTLDLGALAGTHTLPMIMNNRFYADLATPWFYQSVTGQVTFTFSPQL